MEIVVLIGAWALISIPVTLAFCAASAFGMGSDETGNPPKAGSVGQNPAGCDGFRV